MSAAGMNKETVVGMGEDCWAIARVAERAAAEERRWRDFIIAIDSVM